MLTIGGQSYNVVGKGKGLVKLVDETIKTVKNVLYVPGFDEISFL